MLSFNTGSLPYNIIRAINHADFNNDYAFTKEERNRDINLI